jgi:Fe-Mn family superoxide dismutase
MYSNHYPFTLMELPFMQSALEPYIDSKTIFFHHEKHQKKYVENLNALLRPFGQFYKWPLEKLIIEADKLPKEIQTGVINNAGGVYNHNIYFSQLCGAKSQPSGAMAEAINSQLGSFFELKEKLKEASLSQFGSGYGFLTTDKAGQLFIMNTANQDTVLTRGVYPLIAVDVWEHAYYLKYQNRRDEYINNLFCVLNWIKIGKNYSAVISLHK